MAFVSVIVPTFNHEAFIHKCLESILLQSYSDWQAVVVDDGSNDRTVEIVEKYCNSDARFVLLTQEHKGLERLGENYNTALEQCSGEWVAVLEGDDFWHKEKLSTYVAEIQKKRCVLAWGSAYAVNDSSKVIGEFPRKCFWEFAENRPAGAFLKQYLMASFIPSPTLMFRADVLRDMGGFLQPPGLSVVDYPTVLRFAKKGFFCFLKEPLAYYRIHSGQATSSGGVGADSAGRYALRFFLELPEELRMKIGVSEKMLVRGIDRRRALNHFHRGRLALIAGDFMAGKEFFRKMRDVREWSVQVRAYLGLFHCILKVDLEWIPKILGLRPLK